ncbi:hypothetical protein KY290_017796 [Solanum tuberosum]|uniref:Transposase n=1 Tax=Solanum tuberosum TaxID=4113 RepID=A0ABQ7VEE3_SOLTU|nr:hypothetical protein KY290_017796 [Solanum tuberosum]
MCITAHWIDNEWIMHKRIINFCPISSHRGEDMANEIIKCLCDWGLDKIFTITVDNASSNDVTVKELSKIFTKREINFMNGEHFHVRCMAHILILIVQDGFKVPVVSIEWVRKAVKYIRLSPARWLLSLKMHFSNYVARDIGLLHYFQFVEDEDGSVVGALLSVDWDNLALHFK